MLRRRLALGSSAAALAFGLGGCGDAELGSMLSTAVGSGSSEDAVVLRVVDGDTIKVRLGSGVRDTVRYIGIDTPETVKPNAPIECFGPESSRRNTELVDGKRVRLAYDRDQRDRYGRLLAYVYRASDDLFVNAVLVKEGYATPLRITPNTRFSLTFSGLARTARRTGRGLWRRCEQ